MRLSLECETGFVCVRFDEKARQTNTMPLRANEFCVEQVRMTGKIVLGECSAA
jgi:hypothetical protein